MMHIYVCSHCHAPIDRHAQTRLVTDEMGMSFYHVVPDCYEAHKAKLAREAYYNAIQFRQQDDNWFSHKRDERYGNGG